MIRIPLSIAVVVLLSGCAYMPAPGASKASAGSNYPEQVVIPEAEQQPPLVVEERSTPPDEFDFQTLTDQYIPDEAGDESGLVRGWRVQLYTTKDPAFADSFANRVERILDMPVYTVFDPPYYKIRIGNCEERDAAEEIEKRAISKGFETFIVRDIVDPRAKK